MFLNSLIQFILNTYISDYNFCVNTVYSHTLVFFLDSHIKYGLCSDLPCDVDCSLEYSSGDVDLKIIKKH